MNIKNLKNVIFIISDTHRAKNVGLYGAKPTPTPEIDKLGEKGILFANAYTSITKSDPSITAIMTGKYPMSTGLISHGSWIIGKQEQKLKNIPFLAEILRENGFKTAAIDYFGRWHKRGFSYYSGKIIKDIEEKKIAGNNIEFIEYLRYLDAIFFKIFKRDFFVRFYYCFFPKVIIPRDPADTVIDDAIKVLENFKKEKLFLYVHFRDPHSPYVRPKGLRSFIFDSIEDRYNAEIKFMDSQVGRLVRKLEKLGDLDKTLIVFTADHGENLTEHNIYIAHHDPYEEVVKIPLIFYNPNFHFKKIKSFVCNIDIFPTILDFLKIPVAQNIDGKSLLPLINGKSTKLRNFVFFDDNLFGKYSLRKSRRKLGVRVDNYKYIRTIRGKDQDIFQPFPVNYRVAQEELYDLNVDPMEKNNLAVINKGILSRLRSVLDYQIKSLKSKD